ncbi:MAG: hypothetical protein PUA62_10040 [Lachnospiraceae bacterium]|nr:hypothetical protein [Lachnospiraceae bacterium]
MGMMHMSLTLLDGDGNEIFTYAPEDYQWWITGFDPSHQDVDVGDLTVIGSIDFSDNPELWEAFLAKYGVEVQKKRLHFWWMR